MAWVHGWAISRGPSMPVAIADGLRVDLRQSGNPARFVLHTFDRQRVAALGRELTLRGTEIKTLGHSAALRSALSDDWSMYDPCGLMTVEFTRGVAEARVPYVARIVEDGATLVGVVLDREGDKVSSARLAPSGRYGVIDKVWTQPAHQRRGLGTVLMTKLANRALDSGLTTGLLSATADGRALYSALGWTVVGELAGAFRPRHPCVSPSDQSV